MASLPYEDPADWERARGTTLTRTVHVSQDAQKLLALQEQLQPSLHAHSNNGEDDVAAAAAIEHLQEVGRRVLVLKEHAKKPDKKALKLQEKMVPKHVIPSRYGELTDAEADVSDEALEGRLATMLLDQEWDTRTWNAVKIRAAIEALYHEVEESNQLERRELATTMLVRLLETHEGDVKALQVVVTDPAVDFVDSTIPILMNKAFRGISKITDSQKIFRVATLLARLSEWFADIMSRENAVSKSATSLLREVDVCAKVLQHHWRGVMFERNLRRRDCDPVVRTRLRAMHLVKLIELRHQFRVQREAVGAGGLPVDVVRAYLTILFHLTQQSEQIKPALVMSNLRRVLGSGVLVYLASIMTAHQHRDMLEMVKAVAQAIVTQLPDQVVELMKCNIVHRVALDMQRVIAITPLDVNALMSSIRLLFGIASAIATTKAQLDRQQVPDDRNIIRRHGVSSSHQSAESIFLLKQLETTTSKHLLTPFVLEMALQMLVAAETEPSVVVLSLETLRLVASTFGFAQLLDSLTRNGGRHLSRVTHCFGRGGAVASSALALFCEMTDREDARQGFTTAGAIITFLSWTNMGIETTKEPLLFVLGIGGMALLARQASSRSSLQSILSALGSFEQCLDMAYELLLDLVHNKPSKLCERAGAFLYAVNALSVLLRFLVRLTPQAMSSPFQASRHRNISCILLGRLFKAPAIAKACFSEDVINHLALALQCNRLDELEHLIEAKPSTDRLLYQLGNKEACKALSRLARCTAGSVQAKLRPSLTSAAVPELPQAMVCDVMVRLHTLEDLITLVRRPNDAAEFADADLAMVHAAIEFMGYLCPLPYGQDQRKVFLHRFGIHPHGVYAQERLRLLVELAAPAIQQVLREKSTPPLLVTACCAALSRLASTNAACSLLLVQGCLQTALIHLPQILIDTTTKTSPTKAMTKRTTATTAAYVVDTSVDDYGLLGVPASLYRLIGKLCSVAEGRQAVMHMQLVPRLLKRLQLTNTVDREDDDDCKSEIAVVVQQLAMLNAVEGNTSELFLHFNVLDLMVEQLTEHQRRRPTKAFERLRTYRLLDHLLGAIAALSLDVLVCVPRIVALGTLGLVQRFLTRPPLGPDDSAVATHIEALQYHAVTIVHAVASYPFGEFHAALLQCQLTPQGDSSTDNIEAPPVRLMDDIKQIAGNFMLELQHRGSALHDKKAIGELARDTIALVNERKLPSAAAGVMMGTTSTPPLSPVSPPRKAKPARRSASGLSVEQARHDGALPMEPPSSSSSPAALGHSSEKIEFPIAGSNSNVGTNTAASGNATAFGLNLRDTRPREPAPNQGDHQAASKVPTTTYVFARAKDVTRRRRKPSKDASSWLMLDPLFQPPCSPNYNDTSQRHRRRHSSTTPADPSESDHSFPFLQETTSSGHCVNVKARRPRKGDKYIPSLGMIETELL
ncbi:TPA: hypothetical protein N0F65_009366 [Lagenidium giganteum]|uniref:Sister chromatid cohesion protein n=1 Tax=Lagenidium giganteum TaxID=4803 RepID=A0AAV2ZG14_9STRA|nr:TPA: hypothetical protein N0F65_009366 [Lagenidium giganteum]